MSKKPASDAVEIAAMISSTFAQFLFGFPVPPELLDLKRRQLLDQLGGLTARLRLQQISSDEGTATL